MRHEKMKEAKIKAGKYCAYQERTQQEVRDKLYALGLHQDEVEEVLTELITEDYVNEERFAIAYAGGKFRMNKWGRKKIEYALKQKKISDYCIARGVTEIDEKEYKQTIYSIIDKKSGSDQILDYQEKARLAKHIIGKGFEPDLVWSILNGEL